jgi:hypothetical protein
MVTKRRFGGAPTGSPSLPLPTNADPELAVSIIREDQGYTRPGIPDVG